MQGVHMTAGGRFGPAAEEKEQPLCSEELPETLQLTERKPSRVVQPEIRAHRRGRAGQIPMRPRLFLHQEPGLRRPVHGP